MATLSPQDLVKPVRSVFPRLAGDRALAILVDVPRDPARDNPPWAERRALAYEWFTALESGRAGIPLDDIRLIAYPDAGSNNADLPAEAFLLDAPPPDEASDLIRSGLRVTFTHVFAENQLFLAPTEFSTTAPLKVAAKRFGFRAATMPGFAASMVPALRIDYGEVARRVDALKARLDGGIVGPKDFSSPAEVIHLDRIYIPESMPRVAVRSVAFVYPDGREEAVMSAGRYSIFDQIKETP
jgi:hypothetical protein